jgi:hypothetical protein
MPEVTRIGKVTDTEERELDVIADSGHVRLDVAGAVVFLTVSDANRLCNHLIKAMTKAVDQGMAEAIEYTVSDDPEPGGATSAWKHHYG